MDHTGVLSSHLPWVLIFRSNRTKPAATAPLWVIRPTAGTTVSRVPDSSSSALDIVPGGQYSTASRSGVDGRVAAAQPTRCPSGETTELIVLTPLDRIPGIHAVEPGSAQGRIGNPRSDHRSCLGDRRSRAWASLRHRGNQWRPSAGRFSARTVAGLQRGEHFRRVYAGPASPAISTVPPAAVRPGSPRPGQTHRRAHP